MMADETPVISEWIEVEVAAQMPSQAFTASFLALVAGGGVLHAAHTTRRIEAMSPAIDRTIDRPEIAGRPLGVQ